MCICLDGINKEWQIYKNSGPEGFRVWDPKLEIYKWLGSVSLKMSLNVTISTDFLTYDLHIKKDVFLYLGTKLFAECQLLSSICFAPKKNILKVSNSLTVVVCKLVHTYIYIYTGWLDHHHQPLILPNKKLIKTQPAGFTRFTILWPVKNTGHKSGTLNGL